MEIVCPPLGALADGKIFGNFHKLAFALVFQVRYGD